MNGFEEQARSAAADAHESVTRLAVPALDGGAARGGRRLVLAGAAVLALLVAGVFLLRGDNSSNLDVVAEPDAPEGEEAAAVSSYFALPIEPGRLFFARDSEATDAASDARIDLFGAATADDPIGDGFLLVAASTDEQFGGLAGEPVEIRGVTGVASEIAPLVRALEWLEPDGTSIQLASDVLSVEQLVALAETLWIEGLDVAVPTLPDGMQVVADDYSVNSLFSARGGWTLSVANADGQGPTSLTGGPGSEGGLSVLRVVYGAMDPLEVRSTTGYIFVSPENASVLVWREGGDLLTMSAPGGVDILGQAESIAPISVEEWQALVERSADPDDVFAQDFGDDLEAAFEIELDSGSIDVDGETHRWALTLTADSICVMVSDPGGTGAAECTSSIRPGSPVVKPAEADPYQLGYAMGVVSETAETVVVTTATDALEAMIYTHTDGGVETRIFATPLVEPDDVWSVTFFDEAGGSTARWGFESASYPTVGPDSADGSTTPQAEVGYPQIEPRTAGRITAGDLGAHRFGVGRTTDGGDLCVEITSDIVDFYNEACSPYDIVTVENPDGALAVVGLAPACATEVVLLDQDQNEVATTLSEGDRGEAVFAALMDEMPSGAKATGEAVAWFSYSDAPAAWDRIDICTPHF